jgi:hypothetical protein
VVWSNPCTEVSETAKTCTEEHEADMRLHGLDEVTQHTEVRMLSRTHAVDPTGIGRRVFVLPREILPLRERRRKSAEVIVVSRNEPSPNRIKAEDSHTDEGPNMM